MTDELNDWQVACRLAIQQAGVASRLNVTLERHIARLRLTPEERVAIERAASFLEGSGWSGVTLRSILKRHSENLSPMTWPPEVEEEDTGIWESHRHNPD